MHPQALVQKLATAQDRILVASDELAKQNGVESPRKALEAIKAPNQEIKRMFQLEIIADFLEALNKPEPEKQEAPKAQLAYVEKAADTPVRKPKDGKNDTK